MIIINLKNLNNTVNLGEKEYIIIIYGYILLKKLFKFIRTLKILKLYNFKRKDIL